MEVTEFLTTAVKICNNRQSCDDCPLKRYNECVFNAEVLILLNNDDIEKMLKAVETEQEQLKKKTYADDFKSRFPTMTDKQMQTIINYCRVLFFYDVGVQTEWGDEIPKSKQADNSAQTNDNVTEDEDYYYVGLNRWSKYEYTKEQANEAASTLIRCSLCTDCKNCTDCKHCQRCRNCENCHYCDDCRNCSGCMDCGDCMNCHDCENCDENE